jgi:hypothetical protein
MPTRRCLQKSGSFVGERECPQRGDARELFDTERLFELRDFRIARVLDLADKYPRDSLAANILDCVAFSAERN